MIKPFFNVQSVLNNIITLAAKVIGLELLIKTGLISSSAREGGEVVLKRDEAKSNEIGTNAGSGWHVGVASWRIVRTITITGVVDEDTRGSTIKHS